MNILAIIPARGGSKSIHKKNLSLIDGVPLVGWSVRHARAASLINRIVVSTDDPEIAAAGREAGAEVPFMRPAALAEDHVLDLPVFEHVLAELHSREGYRPDLVVHLRPTAPYRKEGDIDRAARMLLDHPDADSIRSVSPPASHPYRVFRIGTDGYLDPVMKHEHPEPHLLRRQDWPPLYFYNCVLDITRPATILEQKSMTGKKILPFIMDPDDVYDIDSPADLAYARFRLEGMSR